LGRNGTLAPRSKAKYDANRITEQSKCADKLADLKWGVNMTSRYASCQKCGLKSAILYWKADYDDDSNEDKAQETYNAGAGRDSAASESFLVEIPCGAVMSDTRCMVAVGGPKWHKQLQRKMDQLGKKHHSEEHEEYFQAGPGEPMASRKK